jgi:hypothetical protein
VRRAPGGVDVAPCAHTSCAPEMQQAVDSRQTLASQLSENVAVRKVRVWQRGRVAGERQGAARERERQEAAETAEARHPAPDVCRARPPAGGHGKTATVRESRALRIRAEKVGHARHATSTERPSPTAVVECARLWLRGRPDCV